MNKTLELLTKHKLHKTHWGKRIILAEKNRGFTSSDIKQAANWTTCACGKQSPLIPRSGWDDSPKDYKLRYLGAEFNNAVHSNKYFQAARFLNLIENQATKVLNELKDEMA